MAVVQKPKVDLNLVKRCCKLGPGVAGSISPFRRAVVLEWSGPLEGDGPVSGVVQCGECSDCYRFNLLAVRGQVRVFAFARVGDQAIRSLELAYGKLSKPSWPIWRLPRVDQLSERDELERTERALVDHAGPPKLVLATKHLVNGRVLAAACYNENVTEWWESLGI